MDSEYAGYYPEWLGRDLLWSHFPWEQGVVGTFPAFLRQYTLHDSSWIGLHLDPGEGTHAILVVRWDAFWSDGRVPHPGSIVSEWPILLIRLGSLRSLRFERFESEWTPRTISDAVTVAEPGGAAHLTEITDTFNGVVLIEHGPEVTFLCLAPSRDAIPIPDLVNTNDR